MDKLAGFGHLEGQEKANTGQLNTQRHMLAMEIEKAKFQESFQQRRAESRQKAAEEKRQRAQELSNLAVERNNAITAAGKTTQRKDFFGRLVSSGISERGTGGAPAPSSPTKYSKYSAHSVFFKFQEGHTNAVRRTVQVRDFL